MHLRSCPWKNCLFETSRLIIRRFYPEDTQGVYELAVNRNQSEMKYMDHPWPSDFEGCRAAAEWFASTDNMWAVCLKPDFNLIGLIVYNSMDENKQMGSGACLAYGLLEMGFRYGGSGPHGSVRLSKAWRRGRLCL